MANNRTRLKPPAEKFLAKANALPKGEAERLMSRMRGRFSRRLEDRKLSQVEVLALQLEFEDEQLREWRKNMAKVREKEKK